LFWSDFFDSTEKINGVVPLYKAGTIGHLYVCLHGAGHSAMSFAALAEKLKQDSTIFAFDFRGHGSHFCENENDLSEDTLISDTIQVLLHVIANNPERAINLVGHSMGGSIATKTASKIKNHMKDSILSKAIVSLFIIDVVEGTAMEALPFME
jgi:protein phosphatase methylesterase 1